MYKKKGKVRKFVICVSVVVCLLLSSVFINRRFNLPNFFIKDGILYLDRMLVKSFSFLNGNDYNELKSENERLNNEINMLKHYEVENEELTSQISKLKGLLKIDKLLSDKEFINSSVLSRGIDYWNESLIIDKGSSDGVSNDMAVVSGGALVGITSSVSGHNSNVLLLCNSKFPINISVKIKVDDKEVYGILNNYNNGMFEVMGIVENISIPSGSSVVTTGLGNIFPSGLLIGYVDSVTTDNFDLSKIVKVKSSIDFNDISYVAVVKR